jgi:hypothetical protein
MQACISLICHYLARSTASPLIPERRIALLPRSTYLRPDMFFGFVQQKKNKFTFKNYLDFEKNVEGNVPSRIEAVKNKAIAYVEKHNK